LDAVCENTDIGFGEWLVDDNSGDLRIDDLMFDVNPILNESYNLRGIIDYSFDNFKLEPRSAEDVNFVVSAEDEELQITNYELRNYPNPFNPSTTISFLHGNEQNKLLQIEIFNLKGQKIKTVSVILSVVEGSAIWDGNDESGKQVSSGLYFARLVVSGKEVAAKKMLLMK
jgi:hypothetical protein